LRTLIIDCKVKERASGFAQGLDDEAYLQWGVLPLMGPVTGLEELFIKIRIPSDPTL
jgi:hypothetical protein